MARLTLRPRSAAIVVGFLVAGSIGWAPPAQALPAAACPVGDGITVVVDFGSQGGGVQIRCVTEPVTSGFDALEKAGFGYQGTTRFPGLLCRIDGKPADDPCVNAPRPDRYWAYWTASGPGGGWSYSDQGAGNRVPPAGSVEGWAFSEGCDRTPGSGPCPTSTTTSTTARPSATAPTIRPGGGPTATTPPSATPAGAGGRGGPSTTAAPDGPTTTAASGDRAPAAGETEDGEVALAAAGEEAAPDDVAGGSATGVVIGALVLLGLGTASVLTLRRRRAGEAGS
jgi:hypothetical protein